MIIAHRLKEAKLTYKLILVNKTGFEIESVFVLHLFIQVVGCVSNRDVSHTMELNSTSRNGVRF